MYKNSQQKILDSDHITQDSLSIGSVSSHESPLLIIILS